MILKNHSACRNAFMNINVIGNASENLLKIHSNHDSVINPRIRTSKTIRLPLPLYNSPLIYATYWPSRCNREEDGIHSIQL